MRLKYVFLALLTGLLSGLSFDFPFFSFLIWFSLVPLFFVIKNNSYKYTFLYSYLAGFFNFLTVIFWISFVTKLGLFFLLLYLSLYWGIFGIISKKFLDKELNFLLIPFTWIILEYIRTNFGGFGWALFGYSQFKFLLFIQVVDLFGVWIISFLIVYLNTALFNFFQRKDKIFFAKQFIIFLILFSSLLIYGFFSLKINYLQKDSFLISIIQPNISQEKKWNPLFSQEIKEKLSFLIKDTPKKSLVIFPEASWPYLVDKDNLKDVEDFVRQANRDTILGVVEREEGRYFNSSFLFSKDGRLVSKYRKINLVPFGEYVPLRRFLNFIEAISSFGDISKGKNLVAFDYKKSKIANLICFEDIFPQFVSKFVKKNTDILLNITNDGWFRGEPEVSQHLQIAVFRAIEQRKILVRAANTGISCIISPQGKVVKSLEVRGKKIFIEGVLSGKIFPTRGNTIYNRLGDVFIYIGLIFCLVRVSLSFIKF